MKNEREKQYAKSPTQDSKGYLDLWWLFGKPRQELRPAIAGLSNFIITVDTAKHRIFQLMPSSVVCVDKIVIVASESLLILGVLSSRIHALWSLRAGGWLGVGNDSVYTKTRTFDPFPFPDATDAQKAAIGAIAEELDAHRKRVLAEHPHLTLTGLYNVLERLKAGAKPDNLTIKERRIFDDGLVLILKELHEKLDSAVAEAYNLPVDLPEEEVLTRLVALNKERAKEEKRGFVRWLRPDYQIPRFGSDKEKAEQLEADFDGAVTSTGSSQKPAFPKDERDQTFAVHQALLVAEGALEPGMIAAQFKQGRRCLPVVSAVLASLFRMGLVSTVDGKSFALRRAA
ncbi:type IIL restriction-modification enzyme MmeI [Phyllobacterium leguminum]|uniref:type IIL restriction-modification enzyme MmeI n=1 Tax=Phyllobacterium leguminum TaxID=314237 RepID=UPI00315DFC66